MLTKVPTQTKRSCPADVAPNVTGLEHMRTDVFQKDAGCRRDDADVRQVLVVITDGQANEGYSPKAQADLLLEPYTIADGSMTKSPGVTTYAVGVGTESKVCESSGSQISSKDDPNCSKDGLNKQELIEMAGSPARVKTVTSYAELGTYAAQLEAALCGDCEDLVIPVGPASLP
jgi:hypothetical protein